MSDMTESLVELRDESGVFVAEVKVADLDNVRGVELAKQLQALVPQVGSGCLIIDLSAVRFIQSQGIGAALLTYNAVLAAGGHVSVCVKHDSVRRMFAVTKIDAVLDIHDDMDTAMRSMRGG